MCYTLQYFIPFCDDVNKIVFSHCDIEDMPYIKIGIVIDKDNLVNEDDKVKGVQDNCANEK